MADENTPETPAVEVAEAAPVVDPSAERLGNIERSVKALTDVVNAAVARAPAMPQSPSEPVKPGTIPAHFRAQLRQHGLTDADIDANAPIVVPFLAAMLATDGQVILGAVQQVRDDVEMTKAARNSKKYPYWNEVEDKIVELREDAQKQGQYLTPADAYKAAVAVDIGSSESRIEAARARIKAAATSNSDDVSANEPGTHHGKRPGQGGVRRTALTGEDLAAMSREDRRKYFETIGDRPIR